MAWLRWSASSYFPVLIHKGQTCKYFSQPVTFLRKACGIQTNMVSIFNQALELSQPYAIISKGLGL